MAGLLRRHGIFPARQRLEVGLAMLGKRQRLTALWVPPGHVWDREQADAIMGTAQPGAELIDEEVKRVTAFLKPLTGGRPRVEYPILPVETDTTPKPGLAPALISRGGPLGPVDGRALVRGRAARGGRLSDTDPRRTAGIPPHARRQNRWILASCC